MHPIAKYRRARGLTQGDLAARVGVSLNTVQTWERGAAPRARYLPKLAEALARDALELDQELREWSKANVASEAPASQ